MRDLTELRLLNGLRYDRIPASLAKAKANHIARALAGASWLIRRKADGSYLAVAGADWVQCLRRDPRTDREVQRFFFDPEGMSAAQNAAQLHGFWAELGLADDYAAQHSLSAVDEPASLVFAGFDRYRRPLWLEDETAAAWRRLSAAAAEDGIAMHAISGFRGHAYQMGIFRRKLARGLSLAQILEVNAAPGFSEHHSGRAIDIGQDGEPPAEESFEHTQAFAWLSQHAAAFGFRLSYPRGNPHGISYEPWHWYHLGRDG